MPVTYIVSDSGKITKSGAVLIFSSGEETKQTIFPHRTEQIVILGNVEITSYALKLLMLHKIDTVFLSKSGKFNGKLLFGDSNNILLRKKQFESLDDTSFCLNIAKSVVIGKLRNQITFLQRTARLREEHSQVINHDVAMMKQYVDQVARADNIDTVRGYEGIGARHYFNSFRLAIIPAWAEFNGRSSRPPKDNVNSVLGFLYTILLYRVDAAIISASLDPYCGYLHSLNFGAKSLAFDIIEEFRVPLADTVCAALFNSGMLEPDDFYTPQHSLDDSEYDYSGTVQNDDSDDRSAHSKAVLLTKSGLKKVISRFETKLDKEIYHESSGRSIKYRKVFFEQAMHLRRYILGEESEYKPFTIK